MKAIRLLLFPRQLTSSAAAVDTQTHTVITQLCSITRQPEPDVTRRSLHYLLLFVHAMYYSTVVILHWLFTRMSHLLGTTEEWVIIVTN